VPVIFEVENPETYVTVVFVLWLLLGIGVPAFLEQARRIAKRTSVAWMALSVAPLLLAFLLPAFWGEWRRLALWCAAAIGGSLAAWMIALTRLGVVGYGDWRAYFRLLSRGRVSESTAVTAAQEAAARGAVELGAGMLGEGNPRAHDVTLRPWSRPGVLSIDEVAVSVTYPQDHAEPVRLPVGDISYIGLQRGFPYGYLKLAGRVQSRDVRLEYEVDDPTLLHEDLIASGYRVSDEGETWFRRFARRLVRARRVSS